MVSLKQLDILLRVAETGSLSHASDLLRLSQPAMSRQIRLLEQELKIEIFKRHGRGMTLTPAGERLKKRIEPSVMDLLHALDDFKTPSESEISGIVRMGNVPSTTPILLPELVSAVNRYYPDVTLRMIEGYPGHMIDWVQRGDIDFALVYGPGSNLHTRVEDICWETMVLVAHAEAGLSLEAPVPFSKLTDFPLILPSREHGLLSIVMRAAERSGLEIDIAHRADSIMMIKGMIQAGFGASVMARSSVEKEIASGQVSAAPIVEPKLMRELVLALPSNRQDREATRAVIRVMAKLICDLSDSDHWKVMPSPALRAQAKSLMSSLGA